MARRRKAPLCPFATFPFRFIAYAAALAVVAFFVLTLQHLSELESHLNLGDIGFVESRLDGPAPARWRDEATIALTERELQEEVDWNLPFVHIITTRFMQNQANLLDLARARLVLFEQFCLPTVIGQSAFARYSPEQNSSASNAGENMTEETEHTADPRFLWIIKTDPDLPPEILSRLVSQVSPYPQFYVVGSNVNFGVGIKKNGGWRGGQAGKDLLIAHNEGRLHCGDVALLRRAHAARNERIILETRLDADDGLNFFYMERIQIDAVKYLSLGWEKKERQGQQKEDANDNSAFHSLSVMNSTNKDVSKGGQSADWMYWCVFAHVAWEPSLGLPVGPSNNSKTSVGSSTELYGLFVPWKSPMACITPGLTSGASVGLGEREIPRFAHQTIVTSFRGPNATAASCGLAKRTDCLKMVSSPLVAAIRSRTPTSAGMKGVSGKLSNEELIMEEKSRDPKMQKSLWAVLKRYFGITREIAKDVNKYVRDHLVEIAKDNLRGQCTKGHSCKLAAREELARLIDLAELVREERQLETSDGMG